MSRHYPKRGMMDWDFQKGNLDDATNRKLVESFLASAAGRGRTN